MNEQQRLFVAVMLCIAIFVGWQYMQQQYGPPPEEPVATAVTEPKPAAEAPSANAPRQAAAAPSADEPVIPAQSRNFASSQFVGTLSSDGAALTQLDLKHYAEQAHQHTDKKPLSLVAGDGPDIAQGRISWRMLDVPALQFDASQGQGDTLVLKGERAGGWQVSVQVTPRADAYALDYVVTAKNIGDQVRKAGFDVQLALAHDASQSSSFLSPGPTAQLFGVCDQTGSLKREEYKSVKDEGRTFDGGTRWAALDRQFFVVAAVPQQVDGTALGTCSMRVAGDVLRVIYGTASEEIPPGSTFERRYSVYVGPKRDDALKRVSPMLPEVIDYDMLHIPLGFMARPMVFLLNVFQQWTSSWGVAIILLTLLVKVLVFPFTYKSIMSGRQMQLIKPEMDRIKQQFAKDPERQQAEQMKLFREKRVNPVGGCLPILVQMPVFIALYRMLSTAVDLYQQPFLWLPDLTLKEAVPVMAILIGGLQVLQQKLTPMPADNQQAKMMLYVMPVVFTVFMVSMPSGLVLYMLVNVILTIIQQLAINKFATSST